MTQAPKEVAPLDSEIGQFTHSFLVNLSKSPPEGHCAFVGAALSVESK